MAEKVTLMILKVNDLQCPCCYKKVKKILRKFPQIRDQEYDEKQNLVKITVVCSCPEKIRDKLCCKGGKVIKSIEIAEPQKPKDKKEPDEKPTEPEPKPKDKKEPDEKPTEPEPKQHPHPHVPPECYCVACWQGYGGGPCHYRWGWPVPPPPCYDIYGYWYGYRCGKGCHVCRCDCFSEEDTGGCNIM